jgi:uncharacterized protein YjbJ (UPF0337 family)
MKPSTTDKVEGKIHLLKGKVKEQVGKVTNNSDLEGEGKAESVAGKVQATVDRLEKPLGEQ